MPIRTPDAILRERRRPAADRRRVLRQRQWRQGPREAILACIENYTTVVVELDEAALDAFRGGTRLQPENAMTETAVKSDYAMLLDLNADYIRAVQTSDVARFGKFSRMIFCARCPMAR